jgi:hypothetical protein
VVEVALSGNLGFVPLDEVLRLLMRSDQRGSVDVRGEDIRGRIFIGKKGITLATTAEDRDLHKHLANSGYVDDAFLRKVVSGESTFADLGEREGAIIDLLREITVESLYHLTEKGATFEVAEDATSPYGSPRPFELEACLDDVRRRADEWASVHAAIADLDSTIRMNRDAGDAGEIKINREAWRLLCELGSGASVKTMAERLGTTEFWIARVAADMAEQKLLVLVEDVPEPAPAAAPQYIPVEDTNPQDSWWVEPQDEAPSDEYREQTDEDEAEAEADGDASGSTEPPSRFGVFGRSVTPTYAPGSESIETPSGTVEDESIEAPYEQAEAPGYQQTEAAPAYEQAEEAAPAGEGEGVEEDTEAFLEKVFSQLEVNGQADVEEEGHGLLRRRRMGSVLKDIDEG